MVEGAAMAMTPAQLVANWLIGNGVSISNVTYNGSSALITSPQIGTFQATGNALSQLGLAEGILMTSGQASLAIGPNSGGGTGVSQNGPGDPDLTALSGTATHDKCVIEFDFVPESDTVEFRYIFGSDEFYDYCMSINDAFGFFLSGPGITGPYSNNAENIALLPGGTLPVTINNMCNDMSTNWCNQPNGNGYQNCPEVNGAYLEYDGFSYIFTAWHAVIPCSTYHIKLAIADAVDWVFDSGVFLERNSFTSVGISLNTSFTYPALGDRAIEGCSNATVNVVAPEPVAQPYTVYFTIGGTAINGVDYTAIPDSVIIPAGGTTASLSIVPLYDGITEGVETVILEFSQPGCSVNQTLADTILIDDNTPFYVNAGPDDTICAGDSATLSGTAWGGQRPFDYNWATYGNHDSIIKVSPPPGSYQYYLHVVEGCGVLESDTMSLLVKPLPELQNTDLSDTICSGAATSIPLSSNLPDSSFIWTSQNVSGAVTGHISGSGDTIIQVLINTSEVTDSVQYTVTPIADGCQGHDTVFTVYVNPVADVLFSPVNQFELCNGQTTEIILSSHVTGSSFSWTVTPAASTSSGFSSGTGDTIIQTLYTSVFVPDTIYYHVTAEFNGCPGQVFDYMVIIHPVPVLTLNPMYGEICSGDLTDIVLTSTCNGALYAWTAAVGVGNVTGFSDGSGPLIQQLLTNHDPVPGSVVYTITASTPTCTASDTTFTEWVKYRALLSNTPPSSSTCNNIPVNVILTSDLPGTTFTWTCTPSSGNVTGFSDVTTPSVLLNQTLVNTGNDPETVTYHMTPNNDGCDGPVTDYTVTVFPTPTITNSPPDTSICSGSNTGIPLRHAVSGTLFTWTCTPSSANITGWSNNASPSDTIFQDLVNTGAAIETVTYHLTPTANGCNGSLTDFTVTVFPVPDLTTSPLAKEICNSQNTNITLASSLNGALFTWMATGSSPNISGYSDNTTTPVALIDQTLVNSGSVNETVTYHILPEANGCYGTNLDYQVTVIPNPYLSNSPLFQEQCNSTNTSLVLTSNVAGTLFSWSCTPSSANITGFANSAVPGTLIQQTLVNTGFDIEQVVYHIDPENTGCLGSTADYTVTIVPQPDVYFSPAAQAICSNDTTSITILSHVPGATLTWTAVASSPTITGYSDGSGAWIGQPLSNAGTTIETVTYTAIPEAFNCAPGVPQSIVVTVYPPPSVVNTTTTFEICNGTSTSIYPESDILDSTFAWRAFSSSSNITGFSGGTGLSISQNLTNSGFSIDTVTYRTTAIANGCTGDSTDFQIIVYPVADVLFTPASQNICSGQTTSLTLQSNVPATSFTWTATGSTGNVSGYSNGSGPLIQQTLVNSGYMPESVTYLVAPMANGCAGTTNSAMVAVNPLPVVSLTPCFDTITTSNAQPIWLNGGIPLAGTYSGVTVNGRDFFPALAGNGIHEIKYTYINEFNCIDSASLSIHVSDPGSLICGDTLLDVRDSLKYPTVLIGTQCWMAANLNYGQITATSIPQRDNCVNEKYCYNNDPALCAQGSVLYQWGEVMRYRTTEGVQGLCPPGWHLPTESDWNTLFNNYISNGFAANPLKYSGYSGFNAYLNGIRFHNLVWRYPASDGTLNSTIFWSGTLHGPDKAWAHGINDVASDRDYTPSVSFYPALKSNAFSVRCIRD